ncbi:WecB/TagA/CpsF family glycosyltransferase [uncultured Cellulomonas sp.]|uniref:WecB/TagA/CpsF family glycosyltransferase n=1 Tax=uncultured Cellulomonas sp. TaxID=189682 RepID=UPI00262D6452|nr:WecB/TagA/CpsF family glycosyltransferase [uncultured Cellulomonas sp.]
MLNEGVTGDWAGSAALLSTTRRTAGPSRHRVLDGYVDAFEVDQFIDMLSGAARRGERALVGNHNMHSLALQRSDARFAMLYEQLDYIFIDGTPVVWLSRLRGPGVRLEHRLAVLDWIWPLFAYAEAHGLSIVHVGGAEPMLGRVRDAALSRHPGLRLTLVDGFFDTEDPVQNQAVVDAISAAKPDVLLVGMGMPRQERWLLANVESMPRCPIVTVGGVLSFIGDDRPTPPRWLGPLGVEWIYRLVTEPTRLWRRYLVEPLPLVPVVALEVLGAVRRSRRRAT